MSEGGGTAALHPASASPAIRRDDLNVVMATKIRTKA
jgi:hypothetical protein